MRKITQFTPVWAVAEGECFSMTPIRYTNGDFFQQGLQISSTHHKPFVVISPLFIKLVDDLSIGTNVKEPVYEETLKGIGEVFQDSERQGCFDSGILAGLFPHSQLHKACECLFDKSGKRADEWRSSTQKIVSELIYTVGVPLLQFKTYEEVRRIRGLG